MEKELYDGMVESLKKLETSHILENKDIFLFGHCNATEELIDYLQEKGIRARAILDNNKMKWGHSYKKIGIVSPDFLITQKSVNLVLIVSRAYEAMASQLRRMGYCGEVYKLVNYNSFAEYSTSDETIQKMKARLQRGQKQLDAYYNRDTFFIYCPFKALGDVFIMMTYLPYFLKKKGYVKCRVFVVGQACANVVKMFGIDDVTALPQENIDEQIQAVIYENRENTYIAHHDRPYVQSVYKALYVKPINLDLLYRCGVFGLSLDTMPNKPTNLEAYPRLNEIQAGNSIILSPYAKSVTMFDELFWNRIVDVAKEKGYQVYTNVASGEKPLDGTLELSVPLIQMQSVVERAGTFIGIRSGLCDVIKFASCKKTAVYPDQIYSDTKWTVKDIYYLDGWDNVLVEEFSMEEAIK